MITFHVSKDMKLSKEQKEEMIEMYCNTKISTKEIAQKFNLSKGGVLYQIRRSGNKVRQKYQWNKYFFNVNYFDSINTEEKAYFLGFLYADGCLYKPTRKISIELQERDFELLEKFNKIINSTYPITLNKKITPKTHIEKGYYTWNVNNLHFSKRCEELGVVERKSLILEFPKENQVPRHLLRHFIRGFFDGDGTIIRSKKNSVSCAITTTTVFLNELQRLVNEETGLFGTKSVCKKNEKLSALRYGGNLKALLFLKFIYDGAKIFLKRKMDRYKEFFDFYIKNVYHKHKSRKERLHNILKVDFSNNEPKDVTSLNHFYTEKA